MRKLKLVSLTCFLECGMSAALFSPHSRAARDAVNYNVRADYALAGAEAWAKTARSDWAMTQLFEGFVGRKARGSAPGPRRAGPGPTFEEVQGKGGGRSD
jgi:hypothetical protein